MDSGAPGTTVDVCNVSNMCRFEHFLSPFLWLEEEDDGGGDFLKSV